MIEVEKIKECSGWHIRARVDGREVILLSLVLRGGAWVWLVASSSCLPTAIDVAAVYIEAYRQAMDLAASS